MGVSSFDVIAGEGVGLHNGWCLETMDFVDFLLRCIQNTQNCVAKALVPVLNGPEHVCHAFGVSVVVLAISCRNSLLLVRLNLEGRGQGSSLMLHLVLSVAV